MKSAVDMITLQHGQAVATVRVRESNSITIRAEEPAHRKTVGAVVQRSVSVDVAKSTLGVAAFKPDIVASRKHRQLNLDSALNRETVPILPKCKIVQDTTSASDL